MSKHTPGPWFTEGVERSGIYVNLGSQQFKVACALFGHPIDEVRANARLIAAAPLMLEALRAIADFIPTTSAKEGGAATHSANVRAADLVRAAIATATGEQP